MSGWHLRSPGRSVVASTLVVIVVVASANLDLRPGMISQAMAGMALNVDDMPEPEDGTPSPPTFTLEKTGGRPGAVFAKFRISTGGTIQGVFPNLAEAEKHVAKALSEPRPSPSLLDKMMGALQRELRGSRSTNGVAPPKELRTRNVAMGVRG